MGTTPADAERLDGPSQEGPPAEAPRADPLGGQGEEAADREVYLAHELPDEWVTELEKPVPPYDTPLDGLVDEPEPGTEARERARRAARTMEELSRGVTLDGLSLRKLIGRDRP